MVLRSRPMPEPTKKAPPWIHTITGAFVTGSSGTCTFTTRQSSLPPAIPIAVCGQVGGLRTGPSGVAQGARATGGAKRRGPTGASA